MLTHVNLSLLKKHENVILMQKLADHSKTLHKMFIGHSSRFQHKITFIRGTTTKSNNLLIETEQFLD